MAISNGFWPLNLSVESLVLREMVPNLAADIQSAWIFGGGVLQALPAGSKALPCNAPLARRVS
jgi:hypothetical protein